LAPAEGECEGREEVGCKYGTLIGCHAPMLLEKTEVVSWSSEGGQSFLLDLEQWRGICK
jgi:hypothetical protein